MTIKYWLNQPRVQRNGVSSCKFLWSMCYYTEKEENNFYIFEKIAKCMQSEAFILFFLLVNGLFSN